MRTNFFVDIELLLLDSGGGGVDFQTMDEMKWRDEKKGRGDEDEVVLQEPQGEMACGGNEG